MGTIKFKCGKCGFEKDIPSQYSGKRVRCPKCQTETRVGQAVEEKASGAKAVTKFHCPDCGQKMGVAAENAGKKVRCPQCKAVITVPGPAQVNTSPAKAPKTVAQVQHKEPESDELRLSMPAMDDLMSMEKQAQSVARLSGKPASTRPVEEDGTSELMRMQAKAGGRPERQQEPKGKSGAAVMAVYPIGAVCSLVIIVGVVMFLLISPPMTSFAAAERFVGDFMTGGRDAEAPEPETGRPAAAEPNVVDSNAAEPNTVGSSESEGETRTIPISKPESNGSDNGEDDITAATASGSQTHGSIASQPGAVASRTSQLSTRRLEGRERANPYGPGLLKALADEQQALGEYLDSHKENVSQGAMERLSPFSNGVGHMFGLVHAEPSLSLVRKAQCYLTDTKEFGFTLTYMPTRSSEKDQTAVFILETKGKDFIIQGMRAKRTIFGWSEAMPARAIDIETKTDNLEIVRKLQTIPGWYWYMGLPCGVAGALIILGSLWVLYDKTDRMGSSSLVPVYNLWVLAEVGGRPGWLSLLLAAAVVPLMLGGAMLYGGFAAFMVIMLIISMGLAKEFDRSIAFAIGLWLMPCAFYPMLVAKIEG
jgi:DNA-directed RNA polymerase subunit RPC12/RpoP